MSLVRLVLLVGLKVDADSPTGAAGLYTSMGWTTKYVTESWHREVPVARRLSRGRPGRCPLVEVVHLLVKITYCLASAFHTT